LEHCEWELVECRDCAQVFHKRLLKEEWEERRFSEWMTEDAMRRYEAEHGTNVPDAVFQRSRRDVDRLLCLEKMTRALRNGDALRILDFGCGWGRFISFGTLFGFDAHGIDRSSARLGRTKSPGRVFPSLQSYCAEVEQPPHAVTLIQVLEHLREPSEVLRAIHALLVASGFLVLEVPNCEGIRQIRTHDDLIIDGIDHINAFTPATLAGIARNAGFVPIKPPTAHVTADFLRVAKREARRLVRLIQRPNTEQFFRRV
jgi:2-polyprenyl-3-methyl-5-hydroxy-6-metoxy-1,4-benzoquinol methylase